MKRPQRSLSVVRAATPFATPPRVLVVADEDDVPEALALVEALDASGADAEVRLAGDAHTDHSDPDAVVFAGAPGRFRAAGKHPVRIGVSGGEPTAAEFDLVVSRPVDASALLGRLGDYLLRS
jgi:hypothetical protein